MAKTIFFTFAVVGATLLQAVGAHPAEQVGTKTCTTDVTGLPIVANSTEIFSILPIATLSPTCTTVTRVQGQDQFGPTSTVYLSTATTTDTLDCEGCALVVKSKFAAPHIVLAPHFKNLFEPMLKSLPGTVPYHGYS